MAKEFVGLDRGLVDLEEVLIVNDGRLLSYGLLLANLLSQGQSSDPMRAIMVALQLRAAVDCGGNLSLEDSDIALVQVALNQASGMSNLIKAQLIKFLELGYPIDLSDFLPANRKEGGLS